MNSPPGRANGQDHAVAAIGQTKLPGDTFQPALASPTIPDYELLRPIGGGAYGEVWLARSKATGALRAAKVVWRQTFHDERPFLREFEGLQRFEEISRGHPSQLALFHIGRNEAEGYFYYVMELADDANVNGKTRDATPTPPPHSRRKRDGSSNLPKEDSVDYSPHTLRAELARGRLQAARALEIAQPLAEALGHLHRHGLVHRDVKPSNVIFVNGRPKLADIGLVTDSSDAQSIVGTEGYLPPEGPGTPQADIFALGKVLYEALTGLERRQFPELPADIRKWPDSRLALELNSVVIKACAADPSERYRDTECMYADLELLRLGRSVKHHRKLQRWLTVCQKALFLVLVIAAVAGVAISVSMALHSPPGAPKMSAIPEANYFYEMGRRFYHKNTKADLKAAIANFEKSLELDPNFAAAHAALAITYCWSFGSYRPDYAKGREHAERALTLDPHLAEAHTALAWIKCMQDWDIGGCEQEFQLALKLALSDPSTHEVYGVFLGDMGKLDESIRQLKEAARLDPISLSIPGLLGTAYLRNHQDELAERESLKVISVETNVPSLAYNTLAAVYENRDDFPTAINLQEKWHLLNGEDPSAVKAKYDVLREAFKANGKQGYWEKQIEWTRAGGGDHTAMLAALYARIGNTNMAFEVLEATRKKHDSSIIANLKSDPAFDSLRSDPRYAELLNKLKLQ